MSKLENFIFTVGIENIICKTHNQPMADALSRSAMSPIINGTKATEYFCKAWIQSPQINNCTFTRKHTQHQKTHPCDFDKDQNAFPPQ